MVQRLLVRGRLALAGIIIVGCTPSPVTLPPVTLLKIGDVCATNADCNSNVCGADKVCTRSCTEQLECPQGFDCGLAHIGDGAPGGVGATCYKAAYPTPPSGGFGTDCGTYSPDPANPATVCDSKVMNPCAPGFVCRGAVKCDAKATCTAECTSDASCPPTYYCATDTGGQCSADSDCAAGFACKPPVAGSPISVCTGKSYCHLRTQCAPAGTADQCPLGYLFAVDTRGEHFCGKVCASDESCPPASNGGSPFFSCVDAGTRLKDPATMATTVCRPVQGACHGTSSIQGVEPGGECSWCRSGIPSDCPKGFCIALQTEEHQCTQPCTVKVRKGANGYSLVASSDKGCPADQLCFINSVPKSCGTTCDAPGFCTLDGNRQNPSCFQ